MFILSLFVVSLFLVGVEGSCRAALEEWEQNGRFLLGAQKPYCEADGTYKPRQCVGSGCYCADKDDNDLGYFTNHGQGTEEMDCKCARAEAEYRKTGMYGKMFFCDTKGSYEARQCLGSVCFCVDENGEELDGSERVPIGSNKALPCELSPPSS